MRIVAGVRQIEAYVVATAREHVTLAVAEADARRAASLNGPATMHFEHDGHVVAIDGRAAGRPAGTVYFLSEDDVSHTDARGAARLAIDLDVTVRGDAGDGEIVATTTVDISETGMRVRATDLGKEVQVVVRLPGDGEPLALRATVVREEPDATAMCFHELSAEDARRLRSIVLAVRRTLALLDRAH